MKITQITIENFQGARAVNISTDRPVILACGSNFAGKSSIRDAVAMALGGTLTRVDTMKASGALVTDGAKASVLDLTADGKRYTVTITAGGKINDSAAGNPASAALAYVLDAQKFPRLSDADRRSFLFGLQNVQMQAGDISKRLTVRLGKGESLPADQRARIDAITPLLRGGFESAAKEAARLATEAKGAWKAVTGETYGSVKAATWRAAVPTLNAPALAQAQTRLVELAASISRLNQDLGAFKARRDAYVQAQQDLAVFRENAALLARRQAKLGTDNIGLLAAQKALDDAEVSAAGSTAPRTGLVHSLARGLSDLLAAWPEETAPGEVPAMDAANTLLDAYEAEHGSLKPTEVPTESFSPAKVAELRQARDLMQRAVQNAQRDVQASQTAAAQVERLEAMEKPDDDGMGALQQELESLQADHAAAQLTMHEQTRARDAAKAAEEKTVKAALHHADVAGHAAIAEALGPDGIPADLMAEALGPLNERLSQSSIDTGWPQVRIEGDMKITYGGRAYALLSESEQWRTQAMFAEAVSHLSGLRLLVLDRMDVLQPSARPELIQWLDIMAANNEIDTALVFATLKGKPEGLPESFHVAWVQDGRCGESLAALSTETA